MYCFDSRRSKNVKSQFTFLLRFCWKLKFVTSAVFAPNPGFVKNDVIDHHLLRQGKHSHRSPSAVHGLAIHSGTSFTTPPEPVLFASCLSYCPVCLLIFYLPTLSVSQAVYRAVSRIESLIYLYRHIIHNRIWRREGRVYIYGFTRWFSNICMMIALLEAYVRSATLIFHLQNYRIDFD